MLSLVHMSGDPELIRGELKPAGLFLNEVQGFMSEEDKAAVRKFALDVITEYRDRGCPDPGPISTELLHEMMQWLVCEPVPEEYVPMVLEEMELDGSDARAAQRSRCPDEASFPSSSSGPANPACWPEFGSRKPASRSRSSRRTPASAALVAEHLPRRAGGCRKPLLLLQL